MDCHRIFIAELATRSDLPALYEELRIFLQSQGVELQIDSDSRVMTARGPPDQIAKVSDLIQLVTHGVSLNRAKEYFLKDEYYLKIDLNDTLAPKDVTRTVARIIGSKGSFKRKLEELTEADIIVHDGSVMIMGSYSSIELARVAIEEVILGKPQSIVIKNLQRRIEEDTWGK